jgi:Cof subfamily protein (haloacid dehalogenase superfamily)
MQKQMNLFKGCLLASDVDGTLIRDGKVCERNIERIKFFINEGGMFSLASGRTPGGVSKILEQLGDISPCVMSNGTVIYDFTKDEAVHQEFISKDDLWVTERIMEEFPDIGIQAHHGKKVLLIRNNGEATDHINYEYLDAVDIDLYTAATYTWNKLIYFANDLEEYKRLCDFTAQFECNSTFVNTGGFAFGIERHYHEQMPNGINKASGIKKLCEMFGIKKGGYFAIGDFYNDLEMLKEADLSATMGDSPEDIKQIVNFVGGTCLEGGVADFIEYLSKSEVQK